MKLLRFMIDSIATKKLDLDDEQGRRDAQAVNVFSLLRPAMVCGWYEFNGGLLAQCIALLMLALAWRHVVKVNAIIDKLPPPARPSTSPWATKQMWARTAGIRLERVL